MINFRKISNRDALITLKKAMGHQSRELEGEEYKEIRLILSLLEPFDSGSSLHCIDEKYKYNGKIYQIIHEIGRTDQLPTVMELTEIEIPDK